MTALVDELAYVVLDTAHIKAWELFARDILGFEVSREGRTARFRMDSRPYRYLLRESAEERRPILGWQVADIATLRAVERRLIDQEIAVRQLGSDQLHERCVEGGLTFMCRNGIVHELVHGLATKGSVDLPGDVTGFVTTPGGLGHVVWSVRDIEAMDRLMLDAFGMTLREDISTPAGPGHFYGCNPRHHSLATFFAPDLRIEHLLVEMNELDDIGRAMDRAIEAGCSITQPLGRHRTDHMVSFYVETPSGFGIEIGCYGLLCGDDWDQVRDTSRCRPWGHGDAMRRHHGRLASRAGEAAETEG